jgi:hypothetical protein
MRREVLASKATRGYVHLRGAPDFACRPLRIHSVNLLGGANSYLTGYGRPTSGRSTDRINANMAILALQANIAYFGTSLTAELRHGAGRWR